MEHKMKILVSIIVFCVYTFGFSANGKFKYEEEETKKQETRKSSGSNTTVSLDPTHLFYMPTSDVLDQREFVLSLHEWALGLDRNLHIFISPFSSYSGIFLGGKYGLSPSSAVGIGLSSDWYWGSRYWWRGDYNYYTDWYGIAGFITKTLSSGGQVAAALKIGNGFIGMEGQYGGYNYIGDLTRLIYEAGAGVGVAPDHDAMVNVDGVIGIRYNIPVEIPLVLTAGIGLGLSMPGVSFYPWPYIDLSYRGNF